MTYFEKKNFYLSEGLFFKIFEYKRQFMEKPLTQNCNAHCSLESFFSKSLHACEQPKYLETQGINGK
jgi:hypothetical protein